MSPEACIPCAIAGCNTDFARRADMQRHVQEYHREPLLCPEPGCTWPGAKRKSRLVTHLQKKHKDIYKGVPLDFPHIFRFRPTSPKPSPYVLGQSTQPESPLAWPHVTPWSTPLPAFDNIEPSETSHQGLIRSCTECRRRKQKCNGASPCNNCERRYPLIACTYPTSLNLQDTSDTNSDFYTQSSNDAAAKTVETRTGTGPLLHSSHSHSTMGMPVLDPGKAGQKRYSCLYRDSLGCEKTFATSGHASRHSKIHEVDKSVSCIWPGCEKTFARRNDMQQHLVAHSRKKFRPGQRGLPNNALEDGIDFLEDSTDLRDTFPVSNAFSEPSKQTVDGAIATQILNGGDVEVLRSKSEDGASNFESKKKNTPTWEDHLATASETPGIGQDVYTGTDTSPTDPPIPNPSDASYPQLQSGVYASISEEGPEDNFEWVCHECGAGPFPAGSISACPRVDCNHLRCEECLREVEASIPFLAKKQLYSRSSSVESLQSLADSIFSIASLSSASTVAEANNAFQRVLAILKADATLKVLYADSIAKTSVDKFNRNLGRLLKRFALDLEGEAKCWNEQRAAQFIRSRARIIAQRVAGSVYPLERESQKIQPRTFEQDKAESSDDSDFEEEPDEFAELESFITNSSAFRKLHDNIRSFLGQERSYKLFEELPFAGEDHIYTLDEPVCYEQCSSPYSRNVWHLPNFSQKIRDILFPEPSIPDGMSRVRWQCSCGEALYDDYRELKPGAAKRMEDYLRRCSYKKCAGDNIRMTERMSDIGSSLKGIISSIGQRIQTLKSGERPALVNTELRYYSDTRTTRTPAHTSEDIFYLLLCHNSGIGAEIVKLRQPDICDINNDQKLFSFLHDEYITLRKRWWTWVSLWTLQSIKFVRFELYENELVDVKKVDEVPPPTKDNDYRHGPPNPPELNPPLGSTLLMHLFKHPELAGTKKHCLKKIPRKLRNRLAVVDEEDDAIGWGLQFIEGWSKKRLMYMTALTSGLSSFIVMILVSILGHDIQNAAAIASFMLSFVTIGIATAQAALHMS